jgi:hypothetical protein
MYVLRTKTAAVAVSKEETEEGQRFLASVSQAFSHSTRSSRQIRRIKHVKNIRSF